MSHQLHQDEEVLCCVYVLLNSHVWPGMRTKHMPSHSFKCGRAASLRHTECDDKIHTHVVATLLHHDEYEGTTHSVVAAPLHHVE